MFYNQPLATRFGTELLRQIDPCWDKLDIAVAWVRASGMVYLSEQLIRFLRAGGELSIIVGIDLLNTTREGLEALLALEQQGHPGRCETYVYHNEAQSVFHPKLYLFRNEEEARLIVGSNNITAAGLYTNVEAGLQTDTAANSPIILEVLDALTSWKDTTSRLAVRLDAALLQRLAAEGYVLDEAAARAQLRRVRQRRTTRRRPSIFGSRNFSPPANPGVARAAASRTEPRPQSAVRTQPAQPAAVAGNVLLMRLRRASATARRTQVQIPIRALNVFFQGINRVISTHSGIAHNINPARAGGSINTIKLEMPEINNFTQPLARFERMPTGIVYQVYDIGSAQGNQILASLQQGRQDGTTQLSISDVNRATWWRFI